MPRTCAEPRCGDAAVEGSTRCETHRLEHNRRIRATHKAFYNTKRWKLARERYLAEHWRCEAPGCPRIAVAVHHDVELSQGGSKRDEANLVALCHQHHAAIHARRRAAV